jgi:hypothetical protein
VVYGFVSFRTYGTIFRASLRKGFPARPLVLQYLKIGEVPSEIATIGRRELIRLYLGVGSDEEIGNQMLAWAAILTVSLEDGSGSQAARSPIGSSRAPR